MHQRKNLKIKSLKYVILFFIFVFFGSFLQYLGDQSLFFNAHFIKKPKFPEYIIEKHHFKIY